MRPRTTLSVLLPLVAAVLSPLAAAEPAHASPPSVGGSMADVVLWDGCQDYPFDYQVDSGGEQFWTASVAISPEAGSGRGLAWGGPTSGTDTVQLCDRFDAPGTYTFSLQLRAGFLEPTYVTSVPDTFTIRRPATQTLVEVSDEHPRPGQRVQVRLVTLVETPTGFVRDDVTRLRLEQRTKKGWRTVAGRKARHGKATTSIRYRGGTITVRGRSAGSARDNDTGSFSAKVRIG